MFEAILEECSMKHIEIEPEYPHQETLHVQHPEIFVDQKAEEQQNAWFLMD